MTSLPIELWKQIYEYCSYANSVKLSSTCKYLLHAQRQVRIPPSYIYHGKEINKNTFKDTVFQLDMWMEDNEKTCWYWNNAYNVGDIEQQDTHILVTMRENTYICRIKMSMSDDGYYTDEEYYADLHKRGLPVSGDIYYYDKTSSHFGEIVSFIESKYPNIVDNFLEKL